MKRDPDLVRAILLQLESPQFDGFSSIRLTDKILSIPGREYKEIAYHIALLLENKYIIGKDITNLGSSAPEYAILRMTSLGHDFLDAVRDDQIWTETKRGIHAAGNATLDFVIELAKGYAKKIIREQIGLDLP